MIIGWGRMSAGFIGDDLWIHDLILRYQVCFSPFSVCKSRIVIFRHVLVYKSDRNICNDRKYILENLQLTIMRLEALGGRFIAAQVSAIVPDALSNSNDASSITYYENQISRA